VVSEAVILVVNFINSFFRVTPDLVRGFNKPT
jgi:hypothetical protein